VVTKRRSTISRRTLPFGLRRWLLSGCPGALYFLERERVRALWDEYGEYITARHIARYPGSRPPNWWRFDRPAPLIAGEPQLDYLERNGLLTSQERKYARRRAS
jgi:hypothetical protein